MCYADFSLPFVHYPENGQWLQVIDCWSFDFKPKTLGSRSIIFLENSFFLCTFAKTKTQILWTKE
jgi:hypothetical protein